MVDYDLGIVGSGGAAFGAAIEARRRDARIVMIEEATVGGTCVNVGCIPSKTLLAAATSRHGAASHPFAGVPTSPGLVDLAALIGQKDDLVGGMRQHKYLDLADAYGFEIVAGHARFKDTTTLTVDGHELSAGAYLVATGTEPTIPPLPGLAEAGFLTSTTAMEQTSRPKRLVLCHGVLMYLDDPAPLLDSLCRLTAPGGLLSIVTKNVEVMAMGHAHEGDWAAALAAFDNDRQVNGLGVDTRGDHVDALSAMIADRGVDPIAWYGVRLFTDGWTPDRPVADPEDLVLQVELEASRRDPYRRLSRLFHLLGRRHQ
jgi:hypothetical protein